MAKRESHHDPISTSVITYFLLILFIALVIISFYAIYGYFSHTGQANSIPVGNIGGAISEAANDGTSSFAYNIWVEPSSYKVLRSYMPTNFPQEINISSAKNEVESFQVVLHSNDTPVYNITLNASDLRGPDGSAISKENIHIFREHQSYIEIPSYEISVNKFRPDYYSDALIPAEIPANALIVPGTPKYKAMPFDLSINETHAFWIDVRVPKGTPAGNYIGSISINSSVQGISQSNIVNFTLTVWDFELPDVPSMKFIGNIPYTHTYNASFDPRIDVVPQQYYENAYALMKDNRMNPTQFPYFGLRCGGDINNGYQMYQPAYTVAYMQDYIDSNNANLIWLSFPKNILPSCPVASPVPLTYAPQDIVYDATRLNAWVHDLNNMIDKINRSNVTYVLMTPLDEPNSFDAYEKTRRWLIPIKRNNSYINGKIKTLVTEQPTSQNDSWGNLIGAADIWVPITRLYDEPAAHERQSLGESVFTYTALPYKLQTDRNRTPVWLIDYSLVEYRVNSWISFRLDIEGILYWSMAYWDETDGSPWNTTPTSIRYRCYDIVTQTNEVPCASCTDTTCIWREVVRYNGDGSLLYPAKEVGFEGFVPSIRLKTLRDSFEEYEYMMVLKNSGNSEASAICYAEVSAVANSWFNYSNTSSDYDDARKRLAGLIVEIQHSPQVLATPSSPINYPEPSRFSCTSPVGLSTRLYINGIDKTAEKDHDIVREPGTYTINCTSMGEIYPIALSQHITYTINPTPPTTTTTTIPQTICGDGLCNGIETCRSCTNDCGQCVSYISIDPGDGTILPISDSGHIRVNIGNGSICLSSGGTVCLKEVFVNDTVELNLSDAIINMTLNENKFVGIRSVSWANLTQQLDIGYIHITLPQGNLNTIFKCDDNGDNCIDVTSSVSIITANESNTVIRIPTSLGFSTYYGAPIPDATTTTTIPPGGGGRNYVSPISMRTTSTLSVTTTTTQATLTPPITTPTTTTINSGRLANPDIIEPKPASINDGTITPIKQIPGVGSQGIPVWVTVFAPALIISSIALSSFFFIRIKRRKKLVQIKEEKLGLIDSGLDQGLAVPPSPSAVQRQATYAESELMKGKSIDQILFQISQRFRNYPPRDIYILNKWAVEEYKKGRSGEEIILIAKSYGWQDEIICFVLNKSS